MQRWGDACLLGGDFDELLEKLHTFAELGAQAHLGDHPELGLVKPAQEQVQVHRGLLNVLPPEGVIDEFQLAGVTWGKKTRMSHDFTGLRGNRNPALRPSTTSCTQLKSSQS